MNTELKLTYIIGQEESWWKGECQCGNFSVHLPNKETIKFYHNDHLFFNHAEYAGLGQTTFLLRSSN